MLVAFLASRPISASAIPGCQGTSTGTRLYRNSGVYTNPTTLETTFFWYEESGVPNPQTQYCITRTSGTCKVKKTGTDDFFYTNTAYNVDYVDIMYCPVDGAVWTLIIAGAIAGAFALRRQLGSADSPIA